MAASRLQQVREEEIPTLVGATETVPQQPPHPRAEPLLMGLLITSLKALSQRTVIAIASLVDLALIASVFVLLLLIISEPTTAQLIGAAGYAVFICICLALLVRRRVG